MDLVKTDYLAFVAADSKGICGFRASSGKRPDTKGSRQLHQMAALAENNIAKRESVSKADTDFLVKKFDNFTRKSAGCLEGMEMGEYIRECMEHPGADTKEHLAELFSMQCRVQMGKLLLEDKRVQL